MSFKVGDTVQLKSGGPDMTVTRIGMAGGEPLVWCAWFEGTKDAYGLFPPDALKTAPEVLKTPPEPADALTERAEPQKQAVAEPRPKAAPEPRRTEVARVTPKPVETSQDPHPTQGKSPPLPEEDEDKITAIQALINTWRKRS